MTDANEPTEPTELSDPAEQAESIRLSDSGEAAAPTDLTPAAEGEGEVEGASSPRPMPGPRAVAAWAVFAVGAVAFDGWVGGGVAVTVAAVVLAGLRRQVLGALGGALLAAVPVAVLADGIPSESEVAPGFVTRSFWPHHLTFAGLTLVGTWVVLDIVGHRHVARNEGVDLAATVDEVAPPFASWSTLARVALVGALGLGAIVASVAVVSS